MPHERDLASIRDMLGCIETIYEHIGGLPKETVQRVKELHDAVLFRLIVLGEAASRVSEESCARFPEIPWVSAVKTRNFLVHVYDHVKREIVWDTIQNDLPPLETALRAALGLPPTPDRTKQRGGPE